MRWTLLLGNLKEMRKSTLSSWGVFRSTLQSGNTKFSNLVIEKNPVNFSHQEGQMSTLQLARIDVSPVKSQKLKKKSIKWKVWSNLIIKKKNKNLTIRKFSKQKKKVQTLPSGRTHKFWFWLKGIARWDLSLAQPLRVWFWLKGIARWDLSLAQPHRFWF